MELAVPEPVDAVFSNAVFHWIQDHDALFARLHAALMAPARRLVAQCGGKGNIDRFRRLADEVAAEPPYAEHMSELRGPLELRRAGRDRGAAPCAPASRTCAAGSSPGR